MAAIDYSTTLAAIDAALVGLDGVNATLGAELRREIADLGDTYDRRWSTDVDGAKTAWSTAASAAWDAADLAARFAEDVVGDPGASLTFDAYDAAPLLARISKARKALPSAATLVATALASHAGNVGRLFAAEGNVAPEFAAYHARGREDVLGEPPGTGPAREQSVRALELALTAKIADANAWLALVAYT